MFSWVKVAAPSIQSKTGRSLKNDLEDNFFLFSFFEKAAKVNFCAKKSSLRKVFLSDAASEDVMQCRQMVEPSPVKNGHFVPTDACARQHEATRRAPGVDHVHKFSSTARVYPSSSLLFLSGAPPADTQYLF